LIAASFTSGYYSNPGYEVFKIDDSFVPRDLKMTFLSLNKTYGWESIPDDLDAWPFRTVYL
jgi:hypothetical protein